MSDRSALLAAIRANPDDDASRLVFADWLDENEPDKKPKKGASPSSWAALIRTECELARLQNDGSAASAVYSACDWQTFEAVRWEQRFTEVARLAELYRTANVLRRAATKALRAGLPKANTGIKWPEANTFDETNRGFVGAATINNWHKFVKALPTLAELCPRVSLDFADNIDPEEVSPPIARNFAKWCRVLAADVYDEMGADLVVALSAVSETTGVRRLKLACGDDEQAARAVTALADSPNWSGLRELILECTNANLPAKLMARLFRAPHLQALTGVWLEGQTTLAAVDALTKLPALRELGFDYDNLDDKAAERLAKARGLSGLRRLQASCSQLTGKGLAALLTSPNLSGLTALNVTLADLSRLPKSALAIAPNGGLRIASFSRCQTGPTAVALAKCPRLSEVICFNAGADLSAADARGLIRALGDRPTAALTMHNAKLDATGAKELANWPGAANLDLLDIWCVNLPYGAAKALADSPHLKNLRHLHYTPATNAAEATIKTAFGDRASYDVLY